MKNPEANPYTKLINTLPEIVLVNSDKEPTEDELNAIKAASKPYKEIFIELGSGSGSHLLERSKIDPNSAYFGFELRYKRAFKTAEKALKAGLKNLFMCRTNANFFPALFSNTKISGIYMNFPDPWDRKRWKKHRMANEEFFKIISKMLANTGYFSFKTDHQKLFEDTLAIINENNDFVVSEKSYDLHKSEFTKNNVETEFEKLFISKKLPIYYLKAEIRGK